MRACTRRGACPGDAGRLGLHQRPDVGRRRGGGAGTDGPSAASAREPWMLHRGGLRRGRGLAYGRVSRGPHERFVHAGRRPGAGQEATSVPLGQGVSHVPPAISMHETQRRPSVSDGPGTPRPSSGPSSSDGDEGVSSPARAASGGRRDDQRTGPQRDATKSVSWVGEDVAVRSPHGRRVQRTAVVASGGLAFEANGGF